MSEVTDACQIVLISGKMIAVAGALSLKAAMLMMKVYNTLYLGKWKGSTSFKRFRDIKGENCEFINVCTEDMALLTKIEAEMTAHNLLFARLPDLCGGDGNTQYVVARSDMHIFKAFLTDHIHGELRNVKVGPIDESDYAKTAVRPETGEFTKEFKDLSKSARETYRESRTVPAEEKKEQDLDASFQKRAGGHNKESIREEIIPAAPPDTVTLTHCGIQRELTLSELMKDPRVRLRDGILRHGERMEVIYDEPVKEGEKWAAFPARDGDHIVIVPKEDMLGGNTARERTYRVSPIEKEPRAMLFAGKSYVVVNMRGGEKSILDGRSVIGMLRGPSLLEQKSRLENLTENMAKNVGPGALLPALPKRRGGR